MQSEDKEDSPVISKLKCPVQYLSPTNTNSQRRVCGLVCDDPQLPKREIAFYLVAMLSIVTYAGYGFYVTYGIDMTKNLPEQALKPGWMREYKDVSAHQLLERASNNWKSLILASVGFLIVSKVTLAYAPMNVHHLACSAYAMLLIGLAVSPQSVGAIVLLYVLYLVVAYFSYAAVWVLTCGLLYCCGNGSLTSVVFPALNVTAETLPTIAAIFSYMLCRFISFGHTIRTELKEQTEQAGFWQYLLKNVPLTLAYTFYMPYQWCGPILTYDAFRKQLESRGRRVAIDSNTVSIVAWRACRMLVWYYVLELIYHYLPVGSYLLTLQPETRIVYKHLSFSVYINGQMFMLLYVQYYGWPAALALLDGVQLYHWPDCISWVYSYSIMWRVFDRGLFSVLQAHIYRPLGGSRRGLVRQLLALIATFSFICAFHGNAPNSRAWVALNVIQLVMERLAIWIYYKNLRSYVTKYLSPQNEKRLTGYIIAWNMMFSIGFVYFFLAGMNGFIIFPEMLLLRRSSWHTPLWHMLTMHFGTYCAVQIGRYYEVKIKPTVCKNAKE